MTFTIWHILGASGIVAILVAGIATIRTRHQDIKKVAYMMDALEDGELNFRFQDKNNKIPLKTLVEYGYIQGDENGKIYNPAASKEEYKDVTDCEFYIETIKDVAEFHICEMNESGKPICPNGPQIEKCYELKLAVDGGK